jgi:hypothetical protein
MANATSVTSLQGKQQFQGIFNEMWAVKALMDVGNLTDGTGETNTVAVPGVTLGDVVLGVSLGVDIAGMSVSAYVSAANVVSVRVQNESGGTLNLAETTIKLVVARPNF